MTSLNETKLDVLFRKLQDKKVILKQEFDEAYAKDDFRTSVALMDSIQKLMLKLSSLEAIDKPFKSICKTVDKIEELKLAIEINFEELGKEIKNLDGLKSIFDSELDSELNILLELFRQEEGKAFDFEWEQFTKEELMTIIHYNKSNFPSRIEEYEEYSMKIAAEPVQEVAEVIAVDLDVPLEIVQGETLESVCVFDVNSEEDEVVTEESRSHPEMEFDHGMDTLSDFERQQHLPVLSDTETLSILNEIDEEPVMGASDIPFRDDSIPSEDSDFPEVFEEPEQANFSSNEEEKHVYADDHLELEESQENEIPQSTPTQEETPVDEEVYTQEAAPLDEVIYDDEVYIQETLVSEEVAYADDTYVEELAPIDETVYEEEVYTDEIPAVDELVYADDAYTEEAVYEDEVYTDEVAYADEVYTEEVVYEDEVYTDEVAYADEVYTDEVAYADEAYTGEVAYEDEAYTEEVAYEDEAYTEEVAYADEAYSGEVAYEDEAYTEDIVYADDSYTDETIYEDEIYTEEMAYEEPLAELTIDDSVEDLIQVENEPELEIDTLEFDEMDLEVTETPEEESLDIDSDDIELDLDEISIDLDDMDDDIDLEKPIVLDDEDALEQDLEGELNLDDIEINLDDEF